MLSQSSRGFTGTAWSTASTFAELSEPTHIGILVHSPEIECTCHVPPGAMLKWGLQEELVVTMPNHGLLQAA